MTGKDQEFGFLGDWLSWTPDSMVPSRWIRCLPLTAWVFDTVRPKLAVEVGTGAGESFRALCLIASSFSSAGRIIGIDEWPVDSLTFRESPLYTGLTEFCATRSSPDVALLRLSLEEAVAEFDPESIDFLHLAHGRDQGRGALDMSMWMLRVRAGGVVMVTSEMDEHLDDVARKEWQQLADCFPAEKVGLPGLVGVAQVPIDGRAPVVEALRSGAPVASALFRSLGERIEYRHVFGSDPVSSDGIRAHVGRLREEHAETVRQADTQYRLSVKALESDVERLSQRLLERTREASRLQDEADRLLALLATRAAASERRTAEMQVQHALIVEGLQAEITRLHLEVKVRADHISALTSTVSWRVTRVLRLLQRLRMSLSRSSR